MSESLYDVFISHATEDKLVAEAICHHFESLGVRCFLAHERILPGAEWQTQVALALRSSRAIVLIVSKHSNQSSNVHDEISVASKAGLHIIQFKLEEVDLHPELVLPLARKHWLDAINPPLAAHIQRLGSALCQLLHITPTNPFPAKTGLGGTEKEAEIPPPPQVQSQPQLKAEKKPSRWPLVLAGALAVALLAGVVVFAAKTKPSRKLELLTPGGEQLEGHTITATRASDEEKTKMVNGFDYRIKLRLPEGDWPKNVGVLLLYKGTVDRSVADASKGTVLVDPAFFWDGNAMNWSPVCLVPNGAERTGTEFTHCYFRYDPTITNSKSRDAVESVLQFFVGKAGHVPAGKIKARLRYYSLRSYEQWGTPCKQPPNSVEIPGELLAQADFTLEIPETPIADADWTLPEKEMKLRLLNADTGEALEKGTIVARSSAAPVWDSTPRSVADPTPKGFTNAFQFWPILQGGGDDIKGPVDFHYYYLKARHTGDPTLDGTELVVDQSLGAERSTLPQGTFIEMRNPNWIPENSVIIKNQKYLPGFVSVFPMGPKGAVPVGEHDFGVALTRGSETLYRSKIRVKVDNEWSLSERDTKISVLSGDGKSIEGQTIQATRLPVATPASDGQAVSTANGVSFPLKFKSNGEAVEGPLNIAFYLKATQAPNPPSEIATLSVATPLLFPKALPQGYTTMLGWRSGYNEIGAGATGELVRPAFVVGQGETPGVIPARIHEVGIEVIAKGNIVVYRGVLKLKVD